MAAPSHLQAAAAQFPQYHFQRSAITSSSLTEPSYLTLLSAYPLPAAAQDALSLTKPLPPLIERASARHHLLAAVSSEPSIKLYNYTHGSLGQAPTLDHFAELKGHTKAIHDIKFHNVHGSYDTAQVETANGACMLSSCSQDGTVKFWDVRQREAALTFRHPKNKPFISCASSGNLLAAGSGVFLFLWDLRTSALLAENEEFHTEDINQIAFHPLNPGTFFTAAEDGLICEIKPEDPDQDEWLQNVINIENPVSRFGFFGPSAEYLWALSCVETLSLWHIEQCERVSDFAQIRDALSVSAHMTIDYLIDAHYDQKSQRVFLASGTNHGELVLSHVNKTEIQPFCLAHVAIKPERPVAEGDAAAASSSDPSLVSPVTGFALKPLAADSPFTLSSLSATAPPAAAAAADDDGDDDMDEDDVDFLKDGEVIMNGGDEAMGEAEAEPPRPPLNAEDQGHTATIRDMLWFDGVLISGGEDSRLCLWSTQNTTPAHSDSSSLKAKQHSAKTTNASSPHQNVKSKRHNPY